RLAEQRPRDCRLVARLEEDRDLPAGSAEGRRHVSGEHEGRASRAARVEVSAPRRQRGDDDPARDRRPERHGAAVDPAADATRSTPLDLMRRHRLPRRAVVGRRVVPGRFASRLRVDIARPQARGAARCRREHRPSARRARGNGEDAVRVGERAGQLARAAGEQRSDLVLRARQLGQLYLYDLATGQLKHQITTSEGNVKQLIKIDEKNRELYFQGVGKEKGVDPYFRHFYKIGMDGHGLTLLTPENADHDTQLSPSGKYLFDTYSTPTTPQTTVVRDLNGKLLVTVGKADISRLLATGWKPPMPI